jgi:hypothetical protein
MAKKPVQPYGFVESFYNGFTCVKFDPGPDTMRLTVMDTEGQQIIFALSRGECAEIADKLTKYSNTKET